MPVELNKPKSAGNPDLKLKLARYFRFKAKKYIIST